MPKSWDKKVILLKEEVTEGTDSTPTTAANALRVLNYQPTFMDADQKVRNIEKAFFGADPVLMASIKRGASFDMEMHGAGAAGTVAQWQKALEYAGFAAASVSAGVSATSTPTSTVKSATHWGYLDNLLLKSIGCRMNVGFTIEDDEFPIFNCSLLGRAPTNLAEEATPGAVTLSGITDPVIASSENTTFTLDTFALPLRRIALNANVDLQYRSLIGPQDKVAYRERSWSGQIVAELPDLTSKNYFSMIRPGTTMVADIVHGTVAGNIVEIDIPKIQISGNVELSEEQGIVMMTIPVTALPNAGNDEIVFISK
jgi:hypothetical protein